MAPHSSLLPAFALIRGAQRPYSPPAAPMKPDGAGRWCGPASTTRIRAISETIVAYREVSPSFELRMMRTVAPAIEGRLNE